MIKSSDPFLKDRIDRYEKWVKTGDIPYSSKIIPIRESVDARQWVLPTDQILKQYKRPDLVVRSDFIAIDDPEECTHCGNCVARCVFDARWISQDEMTYDPKQCYGCGLCATTCPTEAIEMRPVENF